MKTRVTNQFGVREIKVGLSVFILAALTFVASGCATSFPEYVRNGFKVGPNYQPPPAPVPDQWVKNEPGKVKYGNLVKHGDPNLATWWLVFDDPMLNKLLEQAYSQNLTVRAAAEQILAAQAARTIAVGELFPQSQGVAASITRVQSSANLGAAATLGSSAGAALAPSAILSPVAGTGITTTPNSPNASAGIGGPTGSSGVSAGVGRFFSNNATSLNASWELDFWGLFRRNVEAADATLDQSVANRDEIVVMLLANVATQYVQIRTLQERIRLARNNVNEQEPIVTIALNRFKKGAKVSEPGYYQLKSNIENTMALIPPLEAALQQANNQLCILLGQPVHDMLPELGKGLRYDEKTKEMVVHIPQPERNGKVDYSVVVGIPAEYLLRRPDVIAAEEQLKIQSAQIGIAEAEMYPHLGINGSIGLAASSINQLFTKYSWTGSIGPSMTWNILNYGRLLGNVRVQNATYRQFVAQYQNTVLTANQDAENAMIAYLQSIDQAKNLHDSAYSAKRVTDYYRTNWKAGALPGGVDDSAFYNTLFTTINFKVQQEDSAAQAQGNIALNLILLYRAMGGGWQIRLNENCVPNSGSAPASETLRMPEAASVVPGPRQGLGSPVGLDSLPPIRPNVVPPSNQR
jgi:NodT family efflux transporter outer membrane factor (OMF) lipoprotein